MTHCYLRLGDDVIEDATPYPTIDAAVCDYMQAAQELYRYGQQIEATIHIATTFEELVEYPDIVLSLGPRGGLRRQAA